MSNRTEQNARKKIDRSSDNSDLNTQRLECSRRNSDINSSTSITADREKPRYIQQYYRQC